MKDSRTRGFTLVELMFVLVFMSVLLLSILYLTLHTGKLYAKGETNRMMNQVSRELAATIRRDFQRINPSSVSFQQSGSGNSVAGRLCLGYVSYVWNTADLLNDESMPKITAPADNPAVFRRVVDPSALMCARDAGGNYPMSISQESAELLNTDVRSIAVYDIAFQEVSPTDSSRKDALYRIKITLGTNEPETTQRSGAGGGEFVQCKPPTDNSSDFNYCAVNDIDMIVRTGGDG